MSVVNKMLNDLEQRESSEVTQANYQPPAKKPVPVRLLIIILVGAIAIGAALFWPVESSQPVVQSPVVQPINQAANNQPINNNSEAVAQPQGDTTTSDSPSSVEVSRLNPVPTPAQSMQPVNNAPAELPEPRQSASSTQTDTVQASTQQGEITAPPVSNETQPAKPAVPVIRSSTDPNKMALKAQIADAIERNNSNEAIRLLRTLILQQPDNINAKKRLAALYFSEGRSEDAQRLLQDTLSQTPADSSVRLMYARLMAQKNEQELAYYTLKEADDYPPANIELLGFRASIAQQMGKLDAALSDYALLVSLDARNAKWWLGQAVVADKQGERKLAIESYREAYALQSLDANIQRFIAQRLQSLTGVAP